MSQHLTPTTSFLRRLWGTEPFADFCHLHGIEPGPRPDAGAWANAVGGLPEDAGARAAVELSKVKELWQTGGHTRILDVAGGAVPPPNVLDGPAVLLWYLVHHPGVFDTFYFQHHIEALTSWRHATTAGASLTRDALGPTDELREGLRGFFRVSAGTEGFCLIERSQVEGRVCFQCTYGDRVRLLEEFSEAGRRTYRTARPAREVAFVYRPQSGLLSIKAGVRSKARRLELSRLFGRTMLGAELPETCLRDVYALDVLKETPRLPRDKPDMEAAWVKALVLEYPEASGRPRISLEASGRDDGSAVAWLLREHAPRAEQRERLRVVEARLKIRMTVEGRSKEYGIRLTPDSCALNETALGHRFHKCLQTWGLTHGPVA